MLLDNAMPLANKSPVASQVVQNFWNMSYNLERFMLVGVGRGTVWVVNGTEWVVNGRMAPGAVKSISLTSLSRPLLQAWTVDDWLFIQIPLTYRLFPSPISRSPQDVGLEQYTQMLLDQEVTPLVLAHMDEDQLKALGIDTVRGDLTRGNEEVFRNLKGI